MCAYQAIVCAYSEMDITTDFGSVILGSNPGRRTTENKENTPINRRIFFV